jgi:hypothetical protein
MEDYLVFYRQTDPNGIKPDIEDDIKFSADDVEHAIEQAHDHLGHDDWGYAILYVYDYETGEVLWEKYPEVVAD